MSSRIRPLREYGIGDAARLLGVAPAWLKERESRGDLPPPRRTEGGHRTYSPTELVDLRERIGGEAGSERPRLAGRVAFLNQKGGVGKTTLAQNLGLAL